MESRLRFEYFSWDLITRIMKCDVFNLCYMNFLRLFTKLSCNVSGFVFFGDTPTNGFLFTYFFWMRRRLLLLLHFCRIDNWIKISQRRLKVLKKKLSRRWNSNNRGADIKVCAVAICNKCIDVQFHFTIITEAEFVELRV